MQQVAWGCIGANGYYSILFNGHVSIEKKIQTLLYSFGNVLLLLHQPMCLHVALRDGPARCQTLLMSVKEVLTSKEWPLNSPHPLSPVNLLGSTPFRFVYAIILSALAADVLQNILDKSTYYRSSQGFVDALYYYGKWPVVVALKSSMSMHVAMYRVVCPALQLCPLCMSLCVPHPLMFATYPAPTGTDAKLSVNT